MYWIRTVEFSLWLLPSLYQQVCESRGKGATSFTKQKQKNISSGIKLLWIVRHQLWWWLRISTAGSHSGNKLSFLPKTVVKQKWRQQEIRGSCSGSLSVENKHAISPVFEYLHLRVWFPPCTFVVKRCKPSWSCKAILGESHPSQQWGKYQKSTRKPGTSIYLRAGQKREKGLSAYRYWILFLKQKVYFYYLEAFKDQKLVIFDTISLGKLEDEGR